MAVGGGPLVAGSGAASEVSGHEAMAVQGGVVVQAKGGVVRRWEALRE